MKNRKYLLDTTTISDILRRNPLVMSQMRKVSPTELYVSTISQYEIEYGFVKSPKSRKKFEKDLKILYREIDCIPLTTEIGMTAAAIANQLKTKGEPIGLPDVLIAATGLTKSLIVVTNNTRHFARIKDIKLIDWKEKE